MNRRPGTTGADKLKARGRTGKEKAPAVVAIVCSSRLMTKRKIKSRLESLCHPLEVPLLPAGGSYGTPLALWHLLQGSGGGGSKIRGSLVPRSFHPTFGGMAASRNLPLQQQLPLAPNQWNVYANQPSVFRN